MRAAAESLKITRIIASDWPISRWKVKNFVKQQQESQKNSVKKKSINKFRASRVTRMDVNCNYYAGNEWASSQFRREWYEQSSKKKVGIICRWCDALLCGVLHLPKIRWWAADGREKKTLHRNESIISEFQRRWRSELSDYTRVSASDLLIKVQLNIAVNCVPCAPSLSLAPPIATWKLNLN